MIRSDRGKSKHGNNCQLDWHRKYLVECGHQPQMQTFQNFGGEIRN